jgi:hypothetical protein
MLSPQFWAVVCRLIATALRVGGDRGEWQDIGESIGAVSFYSFLEGTLNGFTSMFDLFLCFQRAN